MSQPKNILDVFAITEMLASSQQRTVYRSLEPDTNRDVVVKLLTSIGASGDQFVRRRFQRAMSAMQFLHLPAFPEILHFGLTDDNDAFMVMEWIDGKNLTTLAGAQPQRIIPILSQVAEALEALAMGEVYHHNLSSDNILVQARPEGEAAKIVGLGTAAYFTQATAGTILGHSPEADRFIAPERLLASENSSFGGGALSDLYSLALVTVDVLGGEVLNLESDDPVVHFSDDVRTALPNAEILEEALTGALTKTPDERQTTYAILRNVLERNLALTGGTGEETTTEGRTTIPGSRDIGDPIEEDLIEIGPVTFDPNKTDPTINPEPPPSAPGLPPKQEPPADATPPVPGRKISGLHLNRRLLVWAPVALAVIVIITFGIVMLWRLTHRPRPNPPPVAVVQPTPAPPIPTPEIPVEAEVHPALEEADSLLLEGDVEGARAILSAITPEEVEGFSDEEAGAFRAMKDALEGSRVDAAISDLEGGLQHGSIPMLRRGVAGLQRVNSEEYADRPKVAAMLKRAQAALRLHTLMWEAHDAQDHPLVMERTSRMIEALPKYSTGFRFREEAASALESLSDRAVKAGNHDQANKLLEPVNKFWPERRGLAQRFSAVDEAGQKLEEQKAQIVRALAVGRGGDPEAGLALLNAVTPVDILQGSHSESLNLLQQHLAELDAQPPAAKLKPETDLAFKKNRTVTIPMIITDDHRVTGVTAYLRAAGATGFSRIDLTLDESTDSCTFEVKPETHDNDDFLLYVEATDVSGHTGRLGSPQAPLEFKRKRGLKALFSK